MLPTEATPLANSNSRPVMSLYDVVAENDILSLEGNTAEICDVKVCMGEILHVRFERHAPRIGLPVMIGRVFHCMRRLSTSTSLLVGWTTTSGCGTLQMAS
jgi:hypothetical protein